MRELVLEWIELTSDTYQINTQTDIDSTFQNYLDCVVVKRVEFS